MTTPLFPHTFLTRTHAAGNISQLALLTVRAENVWPPRGNLSTPCYELRHSLDFTQRSTGTPLPLTSTRLSRTAGSQAIQLLGRCRGGPRGTRLWKGTGQLTRSRADMVQQFGGGEGGPDRRGSPLQTARRAGPAAPDGLSMPPGPRSASRPSSTQAQD